MTSLAYLKRYNFTCKIKFNDKNSKVENRLQNEKILQQSRHKSHLFRCYQLKDDLFVLICVSLESVW